MTSSSAFAHGLRPGPGALHVCYCHSPFRYAWFEQERAEAETPWPGRPLMRAILKRNRAWDLEAAGRVSRYVANGKITQDRIMELYGVESEIVHPPVAVERFAVGQPEDFLLFVGQIVPHKRVEVALEAARIAGLPIKIVGDGPDRERLEALYGGLGVEFLGSVSDRMLWRPLLALHRPGRAQRRGVRDRRRRGPGSRPARRRGRPRRRPRDGGTTAKPGYWSKVRMWPRWPRPCTTPISAASIR